MLAAVPRLPLKSNEGKSAGSAHDVTSRVGFTPNVARPTGGVKGMPGPDRVPGPPHDAAPTLLCKPHRESPVHGRPTQSVRSRRWHDAW